MTPLPEPLFILNTGALFGNERDEWEVERVSQKTVDDLCEAQPLGTALGLYDELTVTRLLAAARRQALEDAAQCATNVPTALLPSGSFLSERVADAIRSLIDKDAA